MEKFNFAFTEFYITNVCNLTCQDCRTFSNFDFKGHYKFDQDQLQAWADKMDLIGFNVVGGEPTLHPDLNDWLVGLHQLWPTAQGKLVTNGMHMKHCKDLHETLAECGYNVQITVHNNKFREHIADQIFSVFGECDFQPPQIDPQHEWKGEYNIWLKSSKGVDIEVQNGVGFQAYPVYNNGVANFYKSDPVKAHKSCYIKCNQMIDGKMYKCSLVASGPTFFQQKGVDYPALLDEYVPITSDTVTQENLNLFWDHIEDKSKHIPQCSLCPENNDLRPIVSELKNQKKLISIRNL